MLYCAGWYCATLHWAVLYCTALGGAVLHCGVWWQQDSRALYYNNWRTALIVLIEKQNTAQGS
jgi:hypothetical protein